MNKLGLELAKLESVHKSNQMMNSTLKVGIVGDCHVGKSSLLASFLNKDHIVNHNIKPTIGIDYGVFNNPPQIHSTKNYGSSSVQLWDCSGNESSTLLARGLFPHLDALVLVFDVTDKRTLESCYGHWLHEVRLLSKNITKLHRHTMLLGNKIDSHVFDHSISAEEQHRIADRYDFPFCVRLTIIR